MENKTNLVLARNEENPEERNACVWVAYFRTQPTRGELDEASLGADYYDDSCTWERTDDEVATLAGLQRWLLWY